MNDDPAYAKGFSLPTSHQRVALEIDFAGRLVGSAFLTVYPNNPSLRCVNFHASPLLDIRGVTLSSPTEEEALLPTPASFSHTAPTQPLPNRGDQPIDIRSHPEIKRKTWAALGEEDEGELAILVSNGWVRLVQKGDAVDFAPIQIQIDYTLNLGADVTEGIVFRREGGNEVPHMFLSPTSHKSARIWTPCVDSLWERCTWELEVTVPHRLPGHEDLPVTVISSGELMEQIVHPHTAEKSIFYYLQASPTSIHHVMFAAGPFETHQIHQEDRKIMLGFCLPGDEDDMRNSTSFMSKAMSYYSKEFGVYPFSDYKMVFVSEPRVQHALGATMSIFSSDLLHGPDIIDQVYDTRHVLGLAFAQQWIGVNIIPRTLADTWVVQGLSIYIYNLFLRSLQGNTEYRFRMKRAMDKCARIDQGDKYPICMPGTTEIDNDFINLKSPLVMHILDRHLAKAGTSLGLTRVIPKIFLAALSDELPGNMISTHGFFRFCRKVSGLDLSPFADQWVYGSGCPKMRITTNFIRKKFLVELGVEQTQPAGRAKDHKRPTPFFEGSLTIRIHEADGAPFEHLVDVKTSFKSFNLPFNTKYKRTKRSGRIAARFDHLRDQMIAEDEDSDAQLRDTDRTDVFAYPPWDDESERAEWRVAEWSEEQADAMMSEGSGYEWIRIDPDCEWLAVFEFPEKPWYWISQLQGDKDVVAQLEAVQNLTAYSSYATVASELARTVLVKNFFYRVRMEAAKALVHLDTPDAQFMGSFLLLKLLDHLRHHGKNNFTDIAEYFVLKSVISAVALLREPPKPGESVRMQPLGSARLALLDLLETNDNTDNPFSDCFYTATALSALGNMLGTSQDPRATTAIEKAITFDRLIPSFGNVVTKAGLEAHLKAIMISQITNDASLFLSYTREGNLRSLRLAAIDSLLLCKPLGRHSALTKYLLNVVATDSSLMVRRHVARGLSESVLTALAFGDFINTSSIIDTNGDEQARKDDVSKAIVKAIRSDYNRKPDVMDDLAHSLIDDFAHLDDDVRFALIKIAEMTTSSHAEPLPGHIIKLPTPISEMPPPIPKLRLSIPDAQASASAFATQAMNGPGPVKIVMPGAKKKVLPAQKKGLSEIDLKAITNALAKLNNHHSSYPFRVPVDPVRDQAPDYLNHIKEPMDLQTIQAKLDSGMYSNRQEFVKDVKLIVSNCILYNGSNSAMGAQSKKFDGVFTNIWHKTEATLSSANAGASRPPPKAEVPGPAPTRAPSFDVPESKPSIKIKAKPAPPQAPVPPMAPPPVPLSRKISIVAPTKKRTRDVDDILGDEVDAMASQSQSQPASKPMSKTKDEVPAKKARRSPEKQVAPKKREKELDSYLNAPALPPPPAPAPGPVPVSAVGVTMPTPNPFANEDLPSLSGANVPFRHKRAKQLVSTLQKDPSAVLFLRPVDPEKDGCPTYLDEIKKPRDLGTIAKRVDGKEGKKYHTMQQLGEDIELIFANCRQFNPPGGITALADACESVYRREWPKVINPKMTPDERKAMTALLNRALKDQISLFFREAVDPVLLNIPTYFDVIPQEDARDLSLIKSNLDKGAYSTYKQVDDDIDLMLQNARIFNGEGEVVDAANAFGRWWDGQRKKMD